MPKTRTSETDSSERETSEQKTSLQLIEKLRARVNADLEPVLAGTPPQPSPTSQRQPATSEWLTTSEAARYLKVKTRTLLLWARQGKVKGYTLSGVTRHVWRFRRTDLDATIETPSVRPEERMVQ